MFYPSLISKILLKDGSEVNIDYYNSSATALVGNCILFNRMNSRILTDPGLYIKIKPLDTWTVNGNDIRCEVQEVSDTPIQTSATEYLSLIHI